MNNNRKPSSISRQAGSGGSQSSISRQARKNNGTNVGNNHVACGPWGVLGHIEHFIHIEAHIPDPNRRNPEMA